MKTLKFAIDFIESEEFKQYVKESNRDRSFDCEYAFDLMVNAAYAQDVNLIGLDTFDYETFFWDIYGTQEAI